MESPVVGVITMFPHIPLSVATNYTKCSSVDEKLKVNASGIASDGENSRLRRSYHFLS